MEIKFLKRKGKDIPKRSFYSVTEQEIDNYANGLNDELKVIHFTHTDIGGKVCGLLGHRTFSNIETKYCSHRDVDDIINTFILIDREYVNYDIILVSDVCLNKGTLINLDNVQKYTKDKVKVQYYNHQDKNLGLKYPWAHIETIFDEIQQDSASIMYRWMIDDFKLSADDWLDNLVEKSRRYTKWEWKALEDEVSNSLSMLCHDSGHEFFVKTLIKKHISNSELLTEEDYDKLNYLEKQYLAYKKRKINEVILSRIGNARVGVVFAEQYIDRLGDDIPRHYKNLNSVIIINSLTALNIRNPIDAATDACNLAKIFGGDGEKKAAGASIPVEIREEIINFFINLSEERFSKIKKSR